MDLSTMNTGSTVTKGSTEMKRNIDCKQIVAAVVPEDGVIKDNVSKNLIFKDTSSKELVETLAAKKVAQVRQGRSRGSAQVKVKCRELQIGSFRCRVLTCCSCFLIFVGCFTLEAVIFFSMI